MASSVFPNSYGIMSKNWSEKTGSHKARLCMMFYNIRVAATPAEVSIFRKFEADSYTTF